MVDVLKKLDAAIKVAEFSGTDYPTQPIRAEGLREARAAVAELIEAAHAFRQWVNSGATKGGDAALLRKAEQMNRAALARVGGE